jgi:hypothetical protein
VNVFAETRASMSYTPRVASIYGTADFS